MLTVNFLVFRVLNVLYSEPPQIRYQITQRCLEVGSSPHLHPQSWQIPQNLASSGREDRERIALLPRQMGSTLSPCSHGARKNTQLSDPFSWARLLHLTEIGSWLPWFYHKRRKALGGSQIATHQILMLIFLCIIYYLLENRALLY